MLNRARAQIGIPVLIFLALLVITMVHHRPQRAELVSLASDVAEAEERLTYVIEHSEAFAQIVEYLPPALGEGNVGDQSFLLKMSEKLRELDMTPKTVQPKGEETFGEYMKRGYLVELDCGYADFAEFVEYLENLPELVLIKWFDMRSSEVSAAKEHTVVVRLTVVSN